MALEDTFDLEIFVDATLDPVAGSPEWNAKMKQLWEFNRRWSNKLRTLFGPMDTMDVQLTSVVERYFFNSVGAAGKSLIPYRGQGTGEFTA